MEFCRPSYQSVPVRLDNAPGGLLDLDVASIRPREGGNWLVVRRRFFSFRRIVAFAVNGRHLCAHRPEIHR